MAPEIRRSLKMVPLRERPMDVATAFSPGDYDFLLLPGGTRSVLPCLLHLAYTYGATFSLDACDSAKTRIKIFDADHEGAIRVELWTRLAVDDPGRTTARAIPSAALVPFVEDGPEGPRLNSRVETLLYLSHLATKKQDFRHPLAQARLSRYREACADDSDLLSLLDDLDQKGAAPTAMAAHTRLREMNILAARDPVGRSLDRLEASLERMYRRRRRRKMTRARVIVVTGPDGAGKSALIAELVRSIRGLRFHRFKSLYRHHPLYRLVRWQAASEAPMPKNQIDEMYAASLFRLAVDHWRWLRLGSFFRRCILDRGFPDLCFDGLRRPEIKPALRADWKESSMRMPQPAWHIHLDAADTVISGRKQELSREALSAYRNGIGAILQRKTPPAFSRVDVGQSREAVARCVRKAAEELGIVLPWRTDRVPENNPAS